MSLRDPFLSDVICECSPARAIGVSNFTVSHLRELKRTARVMPMVNQVEFHPYHVQRELLAFCREEGIVLQAYASLGGQVSELNI